MEETNSKKNYFILILLILFIIFLILYISKEAGYYNYKVHERVLLTEESIKKFEEDVKEGKDVKASDYITSNYSDYSNKITIFTSTLGSKIENIMNKEVKKTIKILSKLFWE